MDASLSKIAKTPEPPYYSVTFTSLKRKSGPGYEDTAVEMETLANRCLVIWALNLAAVM